MPINVGIGLSTDKDYIQATKEAVRLAKISLHHEKIDLAIIFSTIEFAHPNTLKAFYNLLGPVNTVGCCGAAIISNQGISKRGLGLMLLNFDEGTYCNCASVKEISAKSSFKAGEELAEKLLYGFKDIRRDLGMIFSDGLIPDGPYIINGLQEKLGKSFPLIGAAASDNLRFLRTYLYHNLDVFSDGVCGILLGGKLNFGLGIKHGWKALGKPHIATLAQGNTVEKIDDMPAVKLYEDYLGYDLAKLKNNLKHISILYPLGVYVPGEQEYLLRNILSIENNGSIRLHGDIPQGSQIRLMIGTKESCLDATRQAAEEAKKGLSGRKVNFALVFDSVSRYILLGRQANQELNIVKNALGENTPIFGLYTYGEQAPLKAINYQGQSYFHNQTISVLGFGG